MFDRGFFGDRRTDRLVHVAERIRRRFGIKLDEFPTWSKIKELSLVANVLKHGSGRSEHDLRKIRPDMFGLDEGEPENVSPILYRAFRVSVEDLRSYADALTAFWEDLGTRAEELLGRVK